MNVYYTSKALDWLHNLIDYVTGPGSLTLAKDIADAIKEGNTYDRLNRRTADGTVVTPLKCPRKGIYAGKTGPPLAPSEASSRVVANFDAEPDRIGGRGYRITAGWRNVVSAKGFPFLPAHDEGRGNLPIRRIFGLSPRTKANVRKLFDAFKAKVKRRRA